MNTLWAAVGMRNLILTGLKPQAGPDLDLAVCSEPIEKQNQGKKSYFVVLIQHNLSAALTRNHPHSEGSCYFNITSPNQVHAEVWLGYKK